MIIHIGYDKKNRCYIAYNTNKNIFTIGNSVELAVKNFHTKKLMFESQYNKTENGGKNLI